MRTPILTTKQAKSLLEVMKDAMKNNDNARLEHLEGDLMMLQDYFDEFNLKRLDRIHHLSDFKVSGSKAS